MKHGVHFRYFRDELNIGYTSLSSIWSVVTIVFIESLHQQQASCLSKSPPRRIYGNYDMYDMLHDMFVH